MATLKEFFDTRNQFMRETGYTGPLSYQEWAKKPETHKAAILFVQFFNEITLAWDKADAYDFADPEEGIFTAMQYLQKQISQTYYVLKSDPSKKATADFQRKYPDECIIHERRIIDENPKKFSGAYIYRVMYNCLYCICHDRKCDKDRWDYETASIVNYDGKELCLFDTLPDVHGSAEDCSEAAQFEREFWSVVRELGASAEKVMRYLLSHDESDLKRLSDKSKNYEADPLRDVEVTLEEVEYIIHEIRERFLNMPSNSLCGRYISNFQVMLSRGA